MRDFARSDDPAVQEQLDRLAMLSLPSGRLSLDPVRTLLARLGNPHESLPPVFHVAGTNGKGSTVAFLRAMLEADGMRVHAYTSPHLVRYNERIRLAGTLIGDAALADTLREVIDAKRDDPASFFEVTTAAAFLAFSRVEADACVVEVGLGGRFDATNVLRAPAVCGIASLGMDHEAFLLTPEDGAPQQPLARIAFEKAGIAKSGVPLVAQAYADAPREEIVRAAARVGAPLFLRGEQWHSAADAAIAYRDERGSLALPHPSLPGAHQADNAALAVAMLRHQDRVTIGDDAMAQGIVAARWPARMQALSDGPLRALLPSATLWLDGGHNRDAADAIANVLTARDRPAIAIIGMLANKDADGFIGALAPHLSRLIAVPVPGHDHHAPFDLATMAARHGVRTSETRGDVRAALLRIAQTARPGEPFDGDILICGSLYLGGEVLRENRERPD